MDPTPDQLHQLQSLGITPSHPKKSPVIPLLSISGITLASFGGLVLIKNRTPAINPPSPTLSNPPSTVSPTQVPKSIQHYLLASQQYFSQALQFQNVIASEAKQSHQPEIIDLLNQSLLAATNAIKEFPSDYRGYYQRGRIYQALIDTQPQLIDTALADISHASSLNPDSAEITREIAALFAKKGDASNTLLYLAKTVSLEPTRAQNFYDLARLQQQVGLISQALETYNRLLPLVTDSSQRQIVESEKTSLENLLSQNSSPLPTPPLASPTIYNLRSTISPDSPLIQANTGSGLIIAASESSKDINVSSLTSTNALSGSATLPSNQTSLTIENSHLSTDSQVYLTVTKGGKGQKLRLVNKTTSSFTVGLDSPTSENIEFKWWIVN